MREGGEGNDIFIIRIFLDLYLENILKLVFLKFNLEEITS